MKLFSSSKFYIVVLALFGLSSLTTQYDIQEEEYTEESEDLDIPNVDESEMDTESILSNVVSDVNKTLTSLYNTVTLANVTTENKTQSTNETRKLVKCKEIVYENVEIEPSVDIINSSSLAKLLQAKPDITSRDMEADCVLVLFYARACPFSAHAAPHFNALARSYPNVKW